MKTCSGFLLAVMFFPFIVSSAYSDEKLYRDNVYKLLVHVSGFRDGNEPDGSEYIAGAGSRFKIIFIDEQYTKIRFIKVQRAQVSKGYVELVDTGYI